MIFVTLGTQLPFERLIKAIDDVAGDIKEDIFAQIGKSSYTPKNFNSVDFLSAKDVKDLYRESSVIIGHAGMGTILSAAKYGKPLIIMARQRKYGEHRNDHQIATAKEMSKLPGVYLVDNGDQISEILRNRDLGIAEISGGENMKSLIINLNNFI